MNRLAKSETNVAPGDTEARRRHWIEHGNRVLWGQVPTVKDGSFLSPRLDLQWACSKDGHYFIEPR